MIPLSLFFAFSPDSLLLLKAVGWLGFTITGRFSRTNLASIRITSVKTIPAQFLSSKYLNHRFDRQYRQMHYSLTPMSGKSLDSPSYG